MKNSRSNLFIAISVLLYLAAAIVVVILFASTGMPYCGPGSCEDPLLMYPRVIGPSFLIIAPLTIVLIVVIRALRKKRESKSSGAKTKKAKLRNRGIILLVIGLVLSIPTGFEMTRNIGPILPFGIGVVLCIFGVVLLIRSRKEISTAM